MTMLMVIAISVLVYLVVGVAFAVMCILVAGEPDKIETTLLDVLFWPVVLLVILQLFAARRIKAWREASREKPAAFSEEEP